jgi:WD40 repeat protein
LGLAQAALAFDRTGQWVVTGGEDRFVCVWSYPAMQPHALVGRDGDLLASVDFNRAGNLVITP